MDDYTPAIKQCSLYSALHEVEPSTYVFDIEYPSQKPNHPIKIVGTVHGLACLAINASDIFMWNPVLRKSKNLPSSNVRLKPPFTFVNYGFGYDESNDDYKVVRLLSVYGSGLLEVEVKVYSLRADSWRRIDDLKGFLPTLYPRMYANGKIYWYARVPGDSTRNRRSVGLDIVSEKYGGLQQPNYDWNFGVVGERPFVFSDYYGTKADLWVMDKYGVEESWCKVISTICGDVHHLWSYSHHRVRNGEIVLENGYGLLV